MIRISQHTIVSSRKLFIHLFLGRKYKEGLKYYILHSFKQHPFIARAIWIVKNPLFICYAQKTGQRFEVSPENMRFLANCLYQLHSSKIDNKVFSNLLLADNKLYDPEKVWGTFYEPVISSDEIKTLRINLLKQSTDIISIKPCLIHGDINQGNILRVDNNVRLIDWSNTRLDNPALDIAQVFLHFGMNQEWDDFIDEYQSHTGSIITNDQLKYFLFLLILWIKLYMKNVKDFQDKADYWVNTIQEFNVLREIS